MSNIDINIENVTDEKARKAITQIKDVIRTNIKAYKNILQKDALVYVDKDVIRAKLQIYKSILESLK